METNGPLYTVSMESKNNLLLKVLCSWFGPEDEETSLRKDQNLDIQFIPAHATKL